jgi:hypothetical protein
MKPMSPLLRQSVSDAGTDDRLYDPAGFILRQATPRHLAIFTRCIPELASTQFAKLLKKIIEVTDRNFSGSAWGPKSRLIDRRH